MEGTQAVVTPAAPQAPQTPAQDIKTEGKLEQKVQEQPKPFKTAKMNLNGKIVEKSWATEADLERDLQKTFGIEEKAQQTAAKVQAAEKLLDYINGKNPEDYKKFVKLCKQNNIDYKKFATDILYDEINYEKMTPEQKKLREYEEKEAERQQIEKEEKDRVESEAKTKKLAEWQQKFEKECIAVLQTKQLPASRLSLAILAQYADASLSNGIEVQISDLVPFVQRDLQQLNQQTLLALEGKPLLDYLGPQILEKISKAKVADYKDESLKPKDSKQTTKPKPKTPVNFKREMWNKRLGW